MINWPSMFPEWTPLNGHKFPRYSHDILTQIGQYGFGRIIFFREKYSGQKITNQFQKLWLATDQIFKNGCSPTNFKKMVGHQPNFEKWLLTDQFQKKWLATNQNLKNGCSPTNFKNYGWPPTKISKMVAHRPISKILVGHRPNSI